MHKFSPILFILIVSLSIFSCRKDSIDTSSNISLSFSTDTILFDTVFTTLGSTTLRLKIFNTSSNTINISNIYVGQGANSQFRINVDGVSGNLHQNIEIDGHDSLFVFAEVTIDPNSGLLPFVVNDNINFVTNGNHQSVALVAWGRNAHYYVANTSVSGISLVYLDRGTSPGPLDSTWINDKPYVIYGGYLTLDGDDKLTINPGVQVHLHNGSGIWVYEDGNINVNGTQADPVVFQGTRLEYSWQDVPGQWDRIWINGNSTPTDNVFNYAIIKNSFIGIQAESDPFNASPQVSMNRLRLNNCEIYNSSAVGILATNYKITDTNSVISNSGQYNLLARGDGDYQFNHTTFANYWDEGNRTTPSIYLENIFVNTNNVGIISNLTAANFYNCIIHGDKDIEFEVNEVSGGTINFSLDYCILKTTNSIAAPNYTNILLNPAGALFVDPSNNDYHLQNGSPANGAGTPSGVSQDKDGILRSPTSPDLGAYELL